MAMTDQATEKQIRYLCDKFDTPLQILAAEARRSGDQEAAEEIMDLSENLSSIISKANREEASAAIKMNPEFNHLRSNKLWQMIAESCSMLDTYLEQYIKRDNPTGAITKCWQGDAVPIINEDWLNGYSKQQPFLSLHLSRQYKIFLAVSKTTSETL